MSPSSSGNLRGRGVSRLSEFHRQPTGRAGPVQGNPQLDVLILGPTKTRIAYDTNRISAKGLEKVIIKAGYQAEIAKP
jgi:hypothetical protein